MSKSKITVHDVKVVTVPIAWLKPAPRNTRKHSKAQIDQLIKSFGEFGVVSPIVVDEDNNILAGHARLEAARLSSLTSVSELPRDTAQLKKVILRKIQAALVDLALEELTELGWRWLVYEFLARKTPVRKGKMPIFNFITHGPNLLYGPPGVHSAHGGIPRSQFLVEASCENLNCPKVQVHEGLLRAWPALKTRAAFRRFLLGTYQAKHRNRLINNASPLRGWTVDRMTRALFERSEARSPAPLRPTRSGRNRRFRAADGIGHKSARLLPRARSLSGTPPVLWLTRG